MLTTTQVSLTLAAAHKVTVRLCPDLDAQMMSRMLQTSASTLAPKCFCGQNVSTSPRAFGRTRPRTVLRRAEGAPKTQTDDTEKPFPTKADDEAANKAPSDNGSDKKKGPRLSFAPNKRSVRVLAHSCHFTPQDYVSECLLCTAGHGLHRG